MSEAEARTFGGFTLLWAGPAFRGLNLTAITPPASSNGSYAIYGSCKERRGTGLIPEGGGCSTPAQVLQRPICAVGISPFIEGEPTRRVRGNAIIQRGGDGLTLWTGTAQVTLAILGNPGLLDDLVAELRGLNTTLTTADDLPPPDFSACPERLLPVRRDGRPTAP